jgi:phenazine biosynthesis protein PhzF family
VFPEKPLRFWHVDAFTDHPFQGNPAAVFLGETPLDAAIKQSIAAELNYAEIAFITLDTPYPRLQWFSPTQEVSLCGHATLAAAHVLFQEQIITAQEILFTTAAGLLPVYQEYNRITLELPRHSVTALPTPDPIELSAYALNPCYGVKFIGTSGHKRILLFEDYTSVLEFDPNLEHIKTFKESGLIISALAGPYASLYEENIDYILRVFSPKLGIQEDYVTGSAHCSLTPLWDEVQRNTAPTSALANKSVFKARQVSVRPGTVYTSLKQQSVAIAGTAVTLAHGIFKL